MRCRQGGLTDSATSFGRKPKCGALNQVFGHKVHHSFAVVNAKRMGIVLPLSLGWSLQEGPRLASALEAW